MLRNLICAVALVALTMTGALADGGHGDKVTLLFESPLANVPGKSIKGVLVDMRRAARRPHIPIQTPPSSPQRCSKAKFAAR